MKVAFVGKGGSGKTTIASLLSRHLAAAKLPVLVIDADINQHMAEALGMSTEAAAAMPPMGLEMDRIKDYLRGSNRLISSNLAMAKTTPPGPGSNLVSIQEDNPIYDHFQRSSDGVRLMSVGPFSEEDLGVKCYHSKTGAAELLLSHMTDGPNEYLIMDMTAGADTFASGMFTKFDSTFLVVEPTLKSLSVYRQYKHHAKDYDVAIKVVGNKVEDSDDVDFLREHVGDDLVAYFTRSEYVRKMEKGSFPPISGLETANVEALRKLQATVDACKQDWPKFYRQTVEFHVKNAKSWANAEAGEDLTQQVDPDFVLDTITAPA